MRSATWPGPCESPGTDSSRAGDGVTYTLSCKMLNRASGSKRMEWTKARGLGRSWWTGAVSVLSIGVMLRIFNLGLKPLHADEGVNGLFLLGLFRGESIATIPLIITDPVFTTLRWSVPASATCC